MSERSENIPSTMEAIRLHAPGGLEDLLLERVATPTPGVGEALVRVHAAAITRDELGWPEDRLPAIPSYELSGVVIATAPEVVGVAIGDEVYALTKFDRDGVAAEYASVPAAILAPKPRTLDHVASAAIPLAALSAWQGLFDHGHLQKGQRVLILGAAGGVGHLATQLAHRHGAYVIGITTPASGERALAYGADEVFAGGGIPHPIEPVDLVFDTVGGQLLADSPAVIRPGGRLVTVAEDPPVADAGIIATYFLVEPDHDQLVVLARSAEDGDLRPAIDSVFPLTDARAAFTRSLARGNAGKVVLRVREA